MDTDRHVNCLNHWWTDKLIGTVLWTVPMTVTGEPSLYGSRVPSERGKVPFRSEVVVPLDPLYSVAPPYAGFHYHRNRLKYLDYVCSH